MRLFLALLSASLLSAPAISQSHNDDARLRALTDVSQLKSYTDVYRLTLYATAIGGAIGCGMTAHEMDREIDRVMAWMMRSFPPSTLDHHLDLMKQGIRYHTLARFVAKRDAPEICNGVRRAYATFKWP